MTETERADMERAREQKMLSGLVPGSRLFYATQAQLDGARALQQMAQLAAVHPEAAHMLNRPPGPVRVLDSILEDEERREHPEWADNDGLWWADYRAALRELD